MQSLQSYCGTCNRDLNYSDMNAYFEVPAESAAQAQKALDRLLVIPKMSRADVVGS